MILARSPQRPSATEIVFAGLIDEENAQAGSRALAASGYKADLAIVGEPTRLRVVTGTRAVCGCAWKRAGRPRTAHVRTWVEMRSTKWRASSIFCKRITRGIEKAAAPIAGLRDRQRGFDSRRQPGQHCACALRSQRGRRTLPGETEPSVRAELATLFRRHKLHALIHDKRLARAIRWKPARACPWCGSFCKPPGKSRRWAPIYFAMLRCWRARAFPASCSAGRYCAGAHGR